MRYIKTKNGKIFDLEGNGVSSWRYVPDEMATGPLWGCEGAFYEIYYYDLDRGEHLEMDGEGGHSMDCINESEIDKTSDTIEELYDELVFNHRFITINFKDKTFLYKDQPNYLGPFGWEKITYEMIDAGIYGAIWVRAGLKYITKMNKKYKLKLLKSS